MEEITSHFHPWCDLMTRQIQPTIQLPKRLQPAAHMDIFDIQVFTTTALTRLYDSESPRLRSIAERNLRALINFTSH